MKVQILVFAFTFFLASCTSSAPPADADATNPASTPPFAEQALVEDLVLANRILASKETGVLDSYGHISVRSQANPNRYYISRWVAPALVTLSDIIENDLDSKPVAGERMDQYPENILHGEIYKARPDVMAVVHLHTPEIVAFSVSSVPLGNNPPQIFPRSGVLNTPDIVRALVEQLGNRNSILAQGHGAVLVGTSLPGVVGSANGMRQNARLITQSIALGGRVNPNPRETAPQRGNAGQGQGQGQAQTGGFAGRQGGNRAWDHWKRTILAENGGRVPAAPPAEQKTAPRSKETIVEDLVLASRILASQELGILDALGHVSVRNPNNPNRYFIPRAVSAGSVTAADIIENDLDSQAVGGPRDDQFQEIYIHGEIYKARPDVMAVVHSHTPELVAFSQSSVPLGIVYNGANFIGSGLKNWVVGRYDPNETLVSNPMLGRALAETLGNDTVVLLAGHGIAHTAPSLYDLVSDVHDLRINAQIQQQAILLSGRINFLPPPAPQPAGGNAGPGLLAPDGSGGGRRGGERAWEYWRQIIKVN
jgi:HCOMODA/2-hydroxy-3-carboxy-muconic semialdehyde decarboxylase